MATTVERKPENRRSTERLERGRSVTPVRRYQPRLSRFAILLGAAGWLATRANRRVIPATPVGTRMGVAAGEIGRGLLAGVAGTLAITLAAAIERHMRNRAQPEKAPPEEPSEAGPVITFLIKIHEPWFFAGDAAGKLIGVTPVDEASRRRFGIAVHWLYGTAWGASLGIMRLSGVRGPLAMGALLTGQLAAEFGVMPAAKLFPPASEWGRQAVVSSIIDHTAYALAAGTVFGFLQRDDAGRV